MIPVSPVIPGYEKFEVNVGEGQPQYYPIPTVVEGSDERRFISRWKFTDHEREQIAAGGELIFQQLTFGLPFQPISMYIEGPQQIDPNEQRAIPDALGEPYDLVEP
jgi:hypothetical protein